MDYIDESPVDGIKDKDLARKVEHSLNVIKQALAEYKLEGVALSFNGGKDCVVLLHLLYLVLSKHNSFSRLRVLYFTHDNSFPEVDSFVQQCNKIYNIKIDFVTTPIKTALVGLVQNGVRAVFMGTRSTDPRCSTLKDFAPTDTHYGWPAFMRVNPILSWTYEDVWKFYKDYECAIL